MTPGTVSNSPHKNEQNPLLGSVSEGDFQEMELEEPMRRMWLRVMRWSIVSGKQAVLEGTGASF